VFFLPRVASRDETSSSVNTSFPEHIGTTEPYIQSNLSIRMWGGPAKIKNISRYSYIKVCNAAKLIPAGLRSIFLYTRIFLYQVFLYRGLTVYRVPA
jgi:hypothetical protein